jgi:hypothetical protein
MIVRESAVFDNPTGIDPASYWDEMVKISGEIATA